MLTSWTSREHLALVAAVEVLLLLAKGFGVARVDNVDQDYAPLPVDVHKERARRQPRDHRPGRDPRRRPPAYGHRDDAGLVQGPEVERHQGDLPRALEDLPEDRERERHEGHCPAEQRRPAVGVLAEDEPAGEEPYDTGVTAAEEEGQ